MNRAILRGMELDAKQRPQSVEEWLDELGWKPDTKINPQSQTESDLSIKLAQEQIRIGAINLWAAVAIGVVSVLVTVLLAVYGVN